MGPSGPRAGSQRAAVGRRVVSVQWGQGTVQPYDGDRVTVLFDHHGYRELFLPAVLQRGLLQTAP
jgi:ATP-dependent DNA helicase RecQ